MGGKKKQTVGYKYYLGQHLILAHGPIDNVSEIIADDKIAFVATNWDGGSIQVNSPNLFGGEDGEGGISGKFDLDMGGPTQTANPYLVSKLSPELVPSFRGVAGVVLNQVYIGTQAYLKKLAFRATRIHKTKSEGMAQWYDEKSEIVFDNTLNNDIGPTSEGWKYLQVSLSDTADYSDPSFNDSAWDTGQTPFASAANHPYSADSGFPPIKNTNWGLNTKLWIRRNFTLLFNNTLNITIFVDNFATVWVNGVLVLPRSGTHSTPSGPAFTHDFVVPSDILNVGNNTIVLLAEDLGVYSYVAFKVASSNLLQLDMNPAHIIRECLTDPDWGMGYQDSDIDDISFTAAADKLYAEKMGMSLLWNKQTTIEEFINEIVKHIDASIYVDKSTGKFKLKLVRFDYDVDDLISLNPSNINHISDFTRPSFGELTNSITVKYYDGNMGKDSSVTIQDIALSQMQGVTINTTVQYPGFTNAAIAARVAQRDLKTLSTPIASCTIYANRDAYPLSIGDVFKLTWPDYGITNLVMRATALAYGDGKSNQVRISCTEDVYALPANAIIVPTPPVWIDPSAKPAVAQNRLTYEVPYLEAIQQNGQAAVDAVIATDPEVGYVGASVGRPSGASLYANMYVNSGGGYTNNATIDFSPTAKLVSNIGKMDTSFSISETVDIDNATVGTWFQIDNELMSIVSYADPVLTVKRGILDTVPEIHNSNSILYFWDNYSSNDETQYVAGESIEVKIAPVTGRGELSISLAPTDNIEIVGRLARPYPPANLKINGEYFTTVAIDVLDLTWAHRDRLLQTSNTYLGFTDGSIGPEPDTKYNLRIIDDSDDSIIHQELNINGLSFNASPYLESATIKIILESNVNGLLSYQAQNHLMQFVKSEIEFQPDELNPRPIIMLASGDKFLISINGYNSRIGFYTYIKDATELTYLANTNSENNTTGPFYLDNLLLYAVNGTGGYVGLMRIQGNDPYFKKLIYGNLPDSFNISEPSFIPDNPPIGFWYTGSEYRSYLYDGTIWSSLTGEIWSLVGSVSGGITVNSTVTSLTGAYIVVIGTKLTLRYENQTKYCANLNGLVWSNTTGDIATFPTSVYSVSFKLYSIASNGNRGLITAIGEKPSDSTTYGLIYSSINGENWSLVLERNFSTAGVGGDVDLNYGDCLNGTKFTTFLMPIEFKPDGINVYQPHELQTVYDFGSGVELIYPGLARPEKAKYGNTISVYKGGMSSGDTDKIYFTDDFTTYTLLPLGDVPLPTYRYRICEDGGPRITEDNQIRILES